MRLPRWVCVAALGCLLLGACAGTARYSPQYYRVRSGDTLYGIAWRHDIDFRDLARWNNIGADFRISVGQVLVLGTSPLSTPGPLPHVAAPPAGAPKERDARAPPAEATAPLRWVWPTDRAASPRAAPSGGILLSGHLGQDVRAASSGRVVYTGSGMRGYGNLIIIKHAESVLSAYGHNREMLVHDGQEVAAGQVIAHMGEDSSQTPTLYFEIRQNGRPVDPLRFLPRIK